VFGCHGNTGGGGTCAPRDGSVIKRAACRGPRWHSFDTALNSASCFAHPRLPAAPSPSV